MRKWLLWAGLTGLLTGAEWKLDERETIRKTFDVSQGSNAKKVLVDNVNGSIHVTGYGGAAVELIAEKRLRAESKEAMEEAKRDVKLDMSQQGNFVRIYEDGPFRGGDGGTHWRGESFYGYTVSFDYTIQVPYKTDLILKNVNGGGVEVRDTSGSFEVSDVNGKINMGGVAGAGRAHTVNGPVEIHFAANPSGGSSFATVNGAVDVYFQPNLSADFAFKTLNGHIYSDFELSGLPQPAGLAENENGRFHFRGRREQSGRAGSGGPALKFETVNGDIRLRTEKR